MAFEADVHADQFLTSISLMQTNEGLVGDQVLPVVPADKYSDFYAIYGTEHFKIVDTLRRPDAEAAEVRFSLSKGNYLAQEHALRTPVPAQITAAADKPPVDPEVDATIQLTEQMKLDREVRQLTVVSDPAQVTQNVALSGTSQWNDYTNSTPLTNLKTARTAVRAGVHREANMFTIAYNAALTLADHPSIKDLIKRTDPLALEVGGLPATIRGLRVMVSSADEDTTGQGTATPTFAPVFNKAALVHYTNPSVGLRSLTFGVTFEVPDAVTGQRGLSVRKWFADGRKSTLVETADTYATKLLAPLGAYLFTTCIA